MFFSAHYQSVSIHTVSITKYIPAPNIVHISPFKCFWKWALGGNLEDIIWHSKHYMKHSKYHSSHKYKLFLFLCFTNNFQEWRAFVAFNAFVGYCTLFIYIKVWQLRYIFDLDLFFSSVMIFRHYVLHSNSPSHKACIKHLY